MATPGRMMQRRNVPMPYDTDSESCAVLASLLLCHVKNNLGRVHSNMHSTILHSNRALMPSGRQRRTQSLARRHVNIGRWERMIQRVTFQLAMLALRLLTRNDGSLRLRAPLRRKHCRWRGQQQQSVPLSLLPSLPHPQEQDPGAGTRGSVKLAAARWCVARQPA